MLTFRVLDGTPTLVQSEPTRPSKAHPFAGAFEVSKSICIRFQVVNKTFETIPFDNIQMGITGRDENGNNVNTIKVSPGVIQKKSSPKAAPTIATDATEPLYILTPGENVFEVSFVCDQVCTVFFNRVTLCIGYVMLDVSNFDASMNENGVIDPRILNKTFLSTRISNVALFCPLRCSIQMELAYLLDDEEAGGRVDVTGYKVSADDMAALNVAVEGPPMTDNAETGRVSLFPIKLLAKTQFKLHFVLVKSSGQPQALYGQESIRVQFTYQHIVRDKTQTHNVSVALPVPNAWRGICELQDVLEPQKVNTEGADATSDHSAAGHADFAEEIRAGTTIDFKTCAVVGESLDVVVTLPCSNPRVKDYLIHCALTEADERFWMVDGKQTLSLMHYLGDATDRATFRIKLIPLKVGKVRLPKIILKPSSAAIGSSPNMLAEVVNEAQYIIPLDHEGTQENVLIIGTGKVTVSMMV